MIRATIAKFMFEPHAQNTTIAIGIVAHFL